MSALGSACPGTEPRTNLGWFPADRRPPLCFQRETQHGDLVLCWQSPRGWKVKRGPCGPTVSHRGSRVVAFQRKPYKKHSREQVQNAPAPGSPIKTSFKHPNPPSSRREPYSGLTLTWRGVSRSPPPTAVTPDPTAPSPTATQTPQPLAGPAPLSHTAPLWRSPGQPQHLAPTSQRDRGASPARLPSHCPDTLGSANPPRWKWNSPEHPGTLPEPAPASPTFPAPGGARSPAPPDGGW